MRNVFEDQKLYFPGLVPEPYIPALGELVLMFSIIENWVDAMVWHVLGVSSDNGQAITAQFRTLTPRFDMLETLVKNNFHDTKKLEFFVTAMDGLRQANGERNNIVHSKWISWNPEDETAISVQIKAQGTLKHRQRTYSEETIRETTKRGSLNLQKMIWFFRENPPKNWQKPKPSP